MTALPALDNFEEVQVVKVCTTKKCQKETSEKVNSGINQVKKEVIDFGQLLLKFCKTSDTHSFANVDLAIQEEPNRQSKSSDGYLDNLVGEYLEINSPPPRA